MRTFITIAQLSKGSQFNKFRNFCNVRSAVCDYLRDGSMPVNPALVVFNSLDFKSLLR